MNEQKLWDRARREVMAGRFVEEIYQEEEMDEEPLRSAQGCLSAVVAVYFVGLLIFVAWRMLFA